MMLNKIQHTPRSPYHDSPGQGQRDPVAFIAPTEEKPCTPRSRHPYLCALLGRQPQASTARELSPVSVLCRLQTRARYPVCPETLDIAQ